MQKVIKDSEMGTKGNVYNKSSQILSHADDIVTGRSTDVLKETMKELMKAARIMGLKINIQKTKYIEVKKKLIIICQNSKASNMKESMN
jgi:hypothetical protein